MLELSGSSVMVAQQLPFADVIKVINEFVDGTERISIKTNCCRRD